MDSMREFLIGYWDTDVRLIDPAAEARTEMRRRGIERLVRGFLADAIVGNAVSPPEWSDLFNVQTYSRDDVRRDAIEFWLWLYDGASLPREPEGARDRTPPLM